ncbi:Uncharacterised protein [Klebsiella pneumoniae]|nr:Uncharacterised protein [Klebsiella pneumoniae]
MFTVLRKYDYFLINQLPVAPAEYRLPADMGTVLAS